MRVPRTRQGSPSARSSRDRRLLLWSDSEPHVLLVETLDSTEPGRVDAMATSPEVGVALARAPTASAGFLLVSRPPGSGSRNEEDAHGIGDDVCRVGVDYADLRSPTERSR
jgi:hypothetical protein